MSFVFYDTETTGTHASFDQILQFAAIRTDEHLNEIDRFEIRCRLLDHVVPSPGAMRVTRMTIEQLIDPALCSHYEMMCKIAEKLRSWSPSIFTGYNTIRFDEQLLRQAFYQCLHPPYLTAQSGNGRTDILTLVQALTAIKPGVLVVPMGDKGKPSYKLDRIAPANGFDHSNAHDALADVEATIHLARLIRDRADQEWADTITHSMKNAVTDFLARQRTFILTECYFNRPYQFALTRIGCDEENPGSIYALDLTADPDSLRRLDDEKLAARLARSPKVVRTIRANAAPVLTRVAATGFAGLLPDDLRDRAERIRDDEELCGRLVAAMANRREYEPSEHVEEQLYSAFTERADEVRMRAFHVAEWCDRDAICESFLDRRLTELGRRLIFSHHPDVMCDEHHLGHRAWLRRRLTGEGYVSVPWMTVQKATDHAVAMLMDCADEDRGIIEGVWAYLGDRRSQIA